MKTRLIFVRHGYSETNQSGFFTGQIDSPLTSIGLVQAEKAAEYLSNISIDKIYSSTLSRAYNTAVPIASKHGLSITLKSGLCEINAGKWQGESFDRLIEISPESYQNWRQDLYKCQCPGGESVKAFFQRVLDTVIEIAEENEGKCVCVVTHATPIRVISCCAMGLRPQRLQDVPWSPNASINIIDYENKEFAFIQRDIADHLKGLETNLSKMI